MRSCVALILIVFVHLPAGFSQLGHPHDLPNYAFIRYDENSIQFPADHKAFDRFFQKLDTAMVRGEGKINMVHLGGSHIQADIYTHRLRQHLHHFALGMNGGRGMVFPFDIARTNNPWNYTVDYSGAWERCRNIDRELACPLGLTGIAVYTSDSTAWLSFDLDSDSTGAYGFDKFKIFYNTQTSAYQPVFADSAWIQKRVVNHQLGYEEVTLDTIHHQVKIMLDKRHEGGERFILHGVYFEKEGSGLVYNAIGVNGSKLESYLKCEYMGDHLQAIDADMVVISIGTNDAYTRRFSVHEYKAYYRALLDRIRAHVPQAAILLTVPNDSYLYRRYANPHTQEMQQVIMELAGEYHCGVWDFYAVMGGMNSSQKWYLTGIMKPDRIHFNKAGYLLKGDLLFNAFGKAYEEYLHGKENEGQMVVKAKKTGKR